VRVKTGFCVDPELRMCVSSSLSTCIPSHSLSSMMPAVLRQPPGCRVCSSRKTVRQPGSSSLFSRCRAARLMPPRAQQKDTPTGPADEQPDKPADRGQAYYAGLLTTDVRTTNDASSADMLSRSLQLAGESGLHLCH
jgi:hypothetical protein